LPPFAVAPAAAWSAVAPLTLLPPAHTVSPSHALRDRFGSAWLVGYDLPQAVAPGSKFSLTLYWLRTAEVGSITALGETHSLAAWPVGALVPVVYRIAAPAAGDTLPVDVDIGQTAQCGWLAPPNNSCALPAIQLVGQAAAQGAVNFANQILLNTAILAT